MIFSCWPRGGFLPSPHGTHGTHGTPRRESVPAWLRPLESWPGSPADPDDAAAAIDPPMRRAKWRKFAGELIHHFPEKIGRKCWLEHGLDHDSPSIFEVSDCLICGNMIMKQLIWGYLGYILPYLQTNPYVETISGFLCWNRNTSGFDSVEALTIFSSCSVRSRSAWEDTSVACIVASSTWLSWRNKLSLRGCHSVTFASFCTFPMDATTLHNSHVSIMVTIVLAECTCRAWSLLHIALTTPQRTKFWTSSFEHRSPKSFTEWPTCKEHTTWASAKKKCWFWWGHNSILIFLI